MLENKCLDLFDTSPVVNNHSVENSVFCTECFDIRLYISKSVHRMNSNVSHVFI